MAKAEPAQLRDRVSEPCGLALSPRKTVEPITPKMWQELRAGRPVASPAR
jgi:hypothetical protein